MDNKKEQETNETPEARLKRIKCPMFSASNDDMENLIGTMNEEKNIQKKVYFAKNLIKELNKLLNCQHFDPERLDCGICRKISQVRKKTAELIIKAEELA